MEELKARKIRVGKRKIATGKAETQKLRFGNADLIEDITGLKRQTFESMETAVFIPISCC